jgi:two-component system, sensor histidine kinase
MLRSYVPNRLANGEVVGIFVLIRDITERRRTAEALHQAYQNLEQRVQERTAELTTLNDQLLREIDERSRVELRLREAKREAERANLSKTKFLAAVRTRNWCATSAIPCRTWKICWARWWIFPSSMPV